MTCAQAVAKGVFGALATHSHLWDDASPKQVAAWAEGQAMTREQAIADALDGLPSAHSAPLGIE
jgi:hypothetical protein